MRHVEQEFFSPYAQALYDYHMHKGKNPLFIVREDGLRSELPVELFFTTYENFSALEKIAIDSVSGDALDVGAGAGRHTKELLNRGVDVTALEIDPVLSDLMIDRGIGKVVNSDIFHYHPGDKYQNILLLNHGLGIAGNLNNLSVLLKHLQRLLKPGGRILADSLDVTKTRDKVHLDYHEKLKREGRYVGEIRMYMEHGSRKGDLFQWLHIDDKLLKEYAQKADFNCRVEKRLKTGEYLAVLSLD